jgi:hypothetical protein
MRTVFRMPGSSSSLTSSMSSNEAMTLCGAGITPDAGAQSTKKRFSSTRSWAIATQAPAGATKLPCASSFMLSAGTFSNSVVTAAHRAASWPRAMLSP